MKRIIVGVDGSPRTPQVVEAAVELARTSHAKLHLVKVVTIPYDLPLEFRTGTVNLEDALVDAAKADLTKASAAIPAELVDGQSVELATPWEGICRKADALRANAIVIGSHGYSGLDRVLGTTAAKVVNHAHCSVLVVRSPVVM